MSFFFGISWLQCPAGQDNSSTESPRAGLSVDSLTEVLTAPYVAICMLLPDFFSLTCKALSCLDLLVIVEIFPSGCGLFLPAYTLAPQPRSLLVALSPIPTIFSLRTLLASVQATRTKCHSIISHNCVVLKWLFA